MTSPVDPFEGVGDLAGEPAALPRTLDPDPHAVERETGQPIQAAPVAPPPPRPLLQPTPVGSAETPKPTTKNTNEQETRLVRIKPYSKKKRQLTRRYTVFGVKFDITKGWYRVKIKVADYLADVTSDGDPDSPAIFDVCTYQQAMEMEERERRRALERAGMGPYRAHEPKDMGAAGLDRMEGVVTSHDLRHGHDSRMRSSRRE